LKQCSLNILVSKIIIEKLNVTAYYKKLASLLFLPQKQVARLEKSSSCQRILLVARVISLRKNQYFRDKSLNGKRIFQ
jgi:hypothetical protein